MTLLPPTRVLRRSAGNAHVHTRHVCVYSCVLRVACVWVGVF